MLKWHLIRNRSISFFNKTAFRWECYTFLSAAAVAAATAADDTDGSGRFHAPCPITLHSLIFRQNVGRMLIMMMVMLMTDSSDCRDRWWWCIDVKQRMTELQNGHKRTKAQMSKCGECQQPTDGWTDERTNGETVRQSHMPATGPMMTYRTADIRSPQYIHTANIKCLKCQDDTRYRRVKIPTDRRTNRPFDILEKHRHTHTSNKFIRTSIVVNQTVKSVSCCL